MQQSTCEFDGCEADKHPKAAKGFCQKHYRQYQDEKAPRCSVDSCDKPSRTRGMCTTHSTRLRRHGVTDDSFMVRFPNSGNCSVEGCAEPMRKRTWCASHYTQWRSIGYVKPILNKWAERQPCVACGKPSELRGNRRFCSDACQAMGYKHDGAPPKELPCHRCGEMIPLVSEAGGKRKRTDIRMCSHCKRARYTRHKMSVTLLAQRDGTDCTICGIVVDMTLRHPDLMRPSVDHVIPFSLGGPHEADNLALAHLRCNQLKRNRIGWTMM